MRSFYVLISLGFVSNFIFSSQEKTNPPNFIFILADDQGWNGTSVRMNDTIPYSCLLYTSPSPRDLH